MMAPNTSSFGLRQDPELRVEPEGNGPGPPPLEASSESESKHTRAMSLSEFLAALGRDLTTPLNSMMNMAGFLLETELTRDQHQMVAGFHGSGQRLLSLVRDALDAVEAETGEARQALIPFDLRVVAEEIATLLQGQAHEKGRSVEYRVHHEVPSRLVGDPGRLRQVLWNLGEHTLESHGAGAVVLRVARLHEDSGSVVLRFDFHFYGADQMGQSAADQVPGGQEEGEIPAVAVASTADLRLAIAERLAGMMGTRVVVDEEPGQLEHAWFDLKLGKQEEAPSEDLPAVSREGLAGRRVLIVDPSEAIRHALAAKLENWGCLVSEAARAEDAVVLVEKAATAGEPFHFVLIERDLPFMSSHELGTFLRSQPGGEVLRMILFAGVGRQGDLALARASGFDAYLPKQVDGQDLGDVLAETERVALTSRVGEERRLVTRHWLAEVRRSRMRLLIVEDDVVSVLVTDWTLRRIGFQVVRVSSAGEMRGLLDGDVPPFDLVILALRLPDTDGLSIIHEIRAAKSGGRSPAIVALGYECTRVERDRCQAAGVDAYVARPVDLGHLCDVVEAITRTATPGGPETEDPVSDGRGLLATTRQNGEEPGRITFSFEVDTTTGQMLEMIRDAKEGMPTTDLDGAMEAYMDVLSPAMPAAPKSPGPAAGDVPVREVAMDMRPATSHAEAEVAEPPASPGGDDPLPVIDLTRLEAVSMNNPTVRAGMVAAYLQRARAALDLVERAASAGDSASVEAEVQRLTQMATSLGAVSCAEVFRQLESVARERAVAGVGPLVVRALAELSRVESLPMLREA